MKLFNCIAVSLFCILMVGCERQADLTNVQKYAKDGVSFSIPGNWKVTEDKSDNGFRYLIVETSGNALLAVNIYPKEHSIALRKHVEDMIEFSIKEMPFGTRTKGTVSEVKSSFEGRTLHGYKNEFVISLTGVNVPHEGVFYSFNSDLQIAYVSSQVATEDFSKVKNGFELVLSTFELR